MTTKSKITPGDLVYMHKRQEKGLGVVVRYIDNIEECIGMNPIEVIQIYKSHSAKEWRKRDLYRQRVCAQSNDPDLAFDFFVYNIAFEDSIKISFVEIEWFKAPSTFNVEGIISTRGWFPVCWIEKY